jgi:hypothetical protein
MVENITLSIKLGRNLLKYFTNKLYRKYMYKVTSRYFVTIIDAMENP